MEQSELIGLYETSLKLEKPPKIRSKKELPKLLMYYFTHGHDDAYSSQISDWANNYTIGQFNTCSAQLSQLIVRKRDEFSFIKQSDEKVSMSYGCKNWKRKYAYQYSFDPSFIASTIQSSPSK